MIVNILIIKCLLWTKSVLFFERFKVWTLTNVIEWRHHNNGKKNIELTIEFQNDILNQISVKDKFIEDHFVQILPFIVEKDFNSKLSFDVSVFRYNFLHFFNILIRISKGWFKESIVFYYVCFFDLHLSNWNGIGLP